MRQLALEDLPDDAWVFFCECGDPECEERVPLTIDAYDDLQEQHRAVVARAHHQINRARQLGEDAQALANQAQQQIKRTAENRRARQQQSRPELT